MLRPEEEMSDPLHDDHGNRQRTMVDVSGWSRRVGRQPEQVEGTRAFLIRKRSPTIRVPSPGTAIAPVDFRRCRKNLAWMVQDSTVSIVIEPPGASPASAGSGAAAGSGAGSGWLEENFPVEEPEGPPRPLAEPFAGWMSLAECASEVAPGVGDVMRSAGLLAQSAIESQADNLGYALTEILAGRHTIAEPAEAAEQSAMARPVVAETVHRLVTAGRLPLSPRLAAENLANSVSDLDQAERGLFDQLVRRTGSEPRTGTDEGEPADYDGLTGQMLLTTGAQLASIAAGVQPPQLGSDPDGYYFGKPSVRWWLTASLELPESIVGSHPVHCLQPQHGWTGDRIRIIESTFNNLDVDDALQQGSVKAGEIRSGYRDTLRDDEVIEFADIVKRPLDQRSYVCRAIIEPDSRALRSIGRIVASHREEIISMADAAAQAAATVISAHPAGTLAAPLIQLLAGLPGAITAHLTSALGRVVEPRSLPAWVISHTVVWTDPTSPLSVFLLKCPDEEVRRMRLHGITGQADPGPTQISADYRNQPKALYNYGRLMWGASRPDVTKPGMPADLWSVVDGAGRPRGQGQPVIWTQPEYDRRGFRVLVPQQRDKARYVTALRADIRFT